MEPDQLDKYCSRGLNRSELTGEEYRLAPFNDSCLEVGSAIISQVWFFISKPWKQYSLVREQDIPISNLKMMRMSKVRPVFYHFTYILCVLACEKGAINYSGKSRRRSSHSELMMLCFKKCHYTQLSPTRGSRRSTNFFDQFQNFFTQLTNSLRRFNRWEEIIYTIIYVIISILAIIGNGLVSVRK